jgi:sec-independent protein translocase protein TatC
MLAYTITPFLLTWILPQAHLIQTQVLGVISVKIYTALMFALVFNYPVWFYHIHKFVFPEKRIRLYVWIPLLFLAGFTFGLQTIPYILNAFTDNTVAAPYLDVESVYWFTLTTSTCFGVIFTLPYWVKKFRIPRNWLRQYRRHALVGSLILTGVISPDPTVTTQLLLTVPFVLMYEVCIWI